MEDWVIYAIVSLFFAGFTNFWYKVVTKRKYNISYVSIISNVTSFLLASLLYIYNNGLPILVDYYKLLLVLAFLDTLFFFFSKLSRVEALNYIDTTIFFPLYKTFFPIILTWVSIVFFHEVLNYKEVLGIIFWIIVPLLLVTKTENKVQKNLRLGLLFVFLTSLVASIASIIQKYVNENWFNIDLFLLASLWFWVIIAFSSYKIGQKKSKKIYSKKGVYKFWIILWILQLFWFYSFLHALSWNLAIAVTINSFSILIPIILSVIFYKEEMTKKKAFVIFLSIVSVILFI